MLKWVAPDLPKKRNDILCRADEVQDAYLSYMAVVD